MAISFPANPNENDSFTSNGKTWVWSGGRWKIVGASNRGLSLEISDAAPSNPVQGDMWYESDSGRTYTYYDNVWIELGNTSAVYSFIADDDTDTLIQVEESADEDVIRFDVGGVEKAVLDSSGLNITGDIEVSGGLSITGDIEVSGSYVGLSSDSVRDADNDTKVEVEVTADSDAIRFTTASTPRFEVTSAGHIVPSEDVTYDLGSSSYRFRDLYLSGNTIDLGGATISYDGTNLHMGAIKMDPSGTGANMMPSGTTAERPASPTVGMFRFNETTGEPEYYSPIMSDWLKFRDGPTVNVSYVLVAGGGGGETGVGGTASAGGGGGGAGGYLASWNNESSGGGGSALSPIVVNTGISSSYTVTIGAGGAQSANGGDSVFHTLTAVGGGEGSGADAAGNGGSGGGSKRDNGSNQGSGTANQGYRGGFGESGPWRGAGGGGGAGAVGGAGGGNGSSAGEFAGNGGVGVASTIITNAIATTYSVGEVSGSDVYFAGGGGGCNAGNSTGGSGGLGGGGQGSTPTAAASGGLVNTGGGGGGHISNLSNNGNSGGSGVLILRYSSAFSIIPSVGLTTNTVTVGSDKVTIITAGTGTVSWS